MGFFNRFFKLQDRNDLIGSYDFHTNEFVPFKSKDFHGQDLLTHGYERNVDAYAVVKKIVDITKSIPWVIEKKTDNGWEKFEDSTLQELIDNPNKFKKYSWQDIQEMYLTFLLCNGNGYLHAEELGGLRKELDVLPSNHVIIRCNDNFFLPNTKYEFCLGKTNETLDNEELSHLRLFNPSFSNVEQSMYGLSAFEVAYRVIQVGNDKWDADAHLLKNRGIAGIISDKSERPMTPDEAKAVQEKFDRESSGTSKFGKIRVTNKDLKYIQMGMSSTDLQLVQKGVITLRAMCNVFGLDSSLFNDPANKTFNNRLEAEKAMYTNAIIPLSEKISQEFTRFLANNHYKEGNVRMRQDFSSVEALQKDKKQEAEKDKIVMEGINTIISMNISTEGKKALLIDDYKMSKDKANAILKDFNNEEV